MAISVCRGRAFALGEPECGEEPPMRMNCGMVLRMSMRTLLSSAGETISMSWRAGTCVSFEDDLRAAHEQRSGMEVAFG